MNKYILVSLFLLLFNNLTSKVNLAYTQITLCAIENTRNVVCEEVAISKSSTSYSFNYNYFKNKLGLLESYNNDTIVNRFGYMGRYQFGSRTLKSLVDKKLLNLTYNEISKNNFIRSRKNQEIALESLTLHNLDILTRYGLMKYVGHNIGGVKITIEGMLAAAHLRGAYSVKKFINSNGSTNDIDGNSTSVRTYMSKFSDIA